MAQQTEYLALVQQCMNFACELMDLCRGTQEVESKIRYDWIRLHQTRLDCIGPNISEQQVVQAETNQNPMRSDLTRPDQTSPVRRG